MRGRPHAAPLNEPFVAKIFEIASYPVIQRSSGTVVVCTYEHAVRAWPSSACELAHRRQSGG